MTLIFPHYKTLILRNLTLYANENRAIPEFGFLVQSVCDSATQISTYSADLKGKDTITEMPYYQKKHDSFERIRHRDCRDTTPYSPNNRT